MMKHIRHIAVAILLAGASFANTSAIAHTSPESVPESAKLPVFSLQSNLTTTSNRQIHRGDRYAQQQSQRRISASQAKSIAMSRVRGARFINVQLVGGKTYRVRLQQKNGRIVDVYVDASTGRVRN